MMASQRRLSAALLSFYITLSLLPLFLYPNLLVEGASLREPRLWASDHAPMPRAPPAPSAAMLRALQYIQSLSQRSRLEPSDPDPTPEERPHPMLQLAPPPQPSTGARDGGGEEEEEAEPVTDKAEQWVMAVLKTLEQTSPPKTPHTLTHSASHTRPLLTHPSHAGNYGSSLWSNLGIQRHHRKFPLMTEDEEKQERPLKRTNEDAEELYTPQKLATLQSVFEELRQITNSKTHTKRQDTEDEDEGGVGDEEDGGRDAAEVDEEELMPSEERIEQNEVETQRHQFNFDMDDRDEQEEDEENDDGEEGQADVKRSSQSDLLFRKMKEDPDDITKLVDYYLLNVLEKTEQQEKKRGKEEEREAEEEEEDKRDRRRRRVLPQDKVDSQFLSQMLQLSQKLQIPPQDVMELLDGDESNKPAEHLQPNRPQSRPEQRPAHTQQTSRLAHDVLTLLGLTDTQPSSNNLDLGLRHTLYDSVPPSGYYAPTRAMQSGEGRHQEDYGEAAGEDKLAKFLAGEMLAQRRRRSALVQDFLRHSNDGQVDTRPVQPEPEPEDDEALQRILDFLNLESESLGERDFSDKVLVGK